MSNVQYGDVIVDKEGNYSTERRFDGGTKESVTLKFIGIDSTGTAMYKIDSFNYRNNKVESVNSRKLFDDRLKEISAEIGQKHGKYAIVCGDDIFYGIDGESKKLSDIDVIEEEKRRIIKEIVEASHKDIPYEEFDRRGGGKISTEYLTQERIRRLIDEYCRQEEANLEEVNL